MVWGIHRVAALLAGGAALLSLGTAWAASPTLDAVRKRGQLVCGVNGLLPGFSAANAAGEWEGLDVDYCRAIAAAVLGDAGKVKYVGLTADKRFDVLAAGEIDVLVRNSTFNLERSVTGKVRFTTPNFYDGQAFVLPRGRTLKRAPELKGETICVTRGTDHEANLLAWAEVEGIAVKTLVLPNSNEMYEAFYDNKCLAITADQTALASTIVRSGRGPLFAMLPDIISKEPLGPWVKSGDDGWLDIVRWTHYALVTAEELNIRSDIVERQRDEFRGIQAKRLLGVVPGSGKALGLDDAWAFNIVKQVGNYGEIFARNVGMQSPLKFGRGLNSLNKECGLMYAPPM
jgi:general L-amino acid transport system substrate-binding protein